MPRVLTPALAAQHDVPRSRTRAELRRGTWRQMARGLVLTRPDEPSRLDWAEAGVRLGGPTAALSGWDALRLLGVGKSATGRILVLTRAGRSRSVGPLLVRRTDRPYATQYTPAEHPGIALLPYVSPARALADAAVGWPSLGDVRAATAQTVQRRLCGVPELAAELNRCPRNGSAHLRTALDEVAEGVRSAAEAEVARRLRRSQLPAFELNVPVLDAHGALPGVVDVLWRAYRAGLEVDSRAYHFEVADWDATLTRHNRLATGALSLLHFSPVRIMRDDGAWLDQLERWLHARARELGVPYRPGSAHRRLPRRPPAPFVLD